MLTSMLRQPEGAGPRRPSGSYPGTCCARTMCDWFLCLQPVYAAESGMMMKHACKVCTIMRSLFNSIICFSPCRATLPIVITTTKLSRRVKLITSKHTIIWIRNFDCLLWCIPYYWGITPLVSGSNSLAIVEMCCSLAALLSSWSVFFSK